MIETTTDNEDPKYPVKIQRFSKNLKVELSKDEIVERAKRCAHLSGEIALMEEERDTAKKHANARIEEREAEAKRLQGEIRDGATWKEVPCETRFVYRTAEVQEVRTDTGEVMHTRPMTDRERQPELPLDQAQEPAAEGEGEPDDGIVDDDYGRDTDENPPTEVPDDDDDEKRSAAAPSAPTEPKLETAKKPKGRRGKGK